MAMTSFFVSLNGENISSVPVTFCLAFARFIHILTNVSTKKRDGGMPVTSRTLNCDHGILLLASCPGKMP